MYTECKGLYTIVLTEMLGHYSLPAHMLITSARAS